MFDLILTLVVVYLGYRGYNWYQQMQEQVRGGQRPANLQQEKNDREDDYIDYEEVE